MPQIIDLGRIRFYFRGVYNPATTYELNDVVKYGGSTYVYVNTIADSANLPTDTDFWAKMTDGVQYEDTYSAGTAYQENDIVIYGSQTYIALSDTTGNLPTNTTYWKVFAGGIGVRGDWTTATLYYPKDVVKRGGTLYVCNIGHTSSAAFATDSAKWSVFVPGFRNRGTWTVSTSYLKDDLVNDGVSTYISLLDHTSGTGVFANESDSRWDLFIAGADYLPSQPGYADYILKTNGSNPVWTKNVSLNDASFATNQHFVGANAQAMATSLELTDYSAVFTVSAGGNSEAFGQFAVANSNADGFGSTDIIAYPNDGNNTAGYIDMGITGANFDSATYGITGPHDGYIFAVAPEGTTGDGNLVFATGDTGNSNSIVFAAGGLTSGTTQMKIFPNEKVHVEIATQSTSPTTGAFTVVGGAGISGNLNVAGDQSVVGNVTIQGSISVAGGQFTTQNLSSTDPMLFVGSANGGNNLDLGFMTEAKFSSTTSRFLFGNKSITNNVATLTTATATVTVRSLTNNVATLTIGSHSFIAGDTITVSGVNATFNGDYTITAVGSTTISYAKTNADVTSAASSGTVQFRIVTGDRQALIVGDIVTLSGIDSTFNGNRTIASVTATQVTFPLTNANVSSAAISPAGLGTRTTRSAYSGIVKDNTTGGWYLFSGLQVKPTTSVDFTLAELSFDDITVGGITAKRGINVFNDSTARDAAIPSPTSGTIIFRKDLNLQEVYIGSTWDAIDPIHPFLLMGV
jgi:hypothetical protein